MAETGYGQLARDAGRFFKNRKPEDVSTTDMAQFTGEALSADRVANVLDEIARSRDLTEQVSGASYYVTPHFLKLMLHRSDNGWGLRVHSLDHSGDNPLVEPWHEHRWTLGSSVLAGSLISDNGVCETLDEADVSEGEFYRYTVEDKRLTGKIEPRFVGSCALRDRFRFAVPNGAAYSSHIDLAHRLVITEPTITAVVTAPDASPTASFIEPTPLEYAERMPQPSLDFEQTRELLQLTASMIREHRGRRDNFRLSNSPVPQLLTAVRA